MVAEVVAVAASSIARGHHVAHHVLNTNSLTPWLHTRLDVAGPTFTVDAPNAILGIVPVGRRRTVLDVADVTGIDVGWRPYPARLMTAALAVGLIVALDPPSVATTVLAAIAAWLTILSYVSVMRIRRRGTSSIVVPICVFQRARARRVADRIAWIADRTR